MKSWKNTLVLALAGVLACCATLLCVGCLGTGGSGSGSRGGSSSGTPSATPGDDSGGSAISGYSGSSESQHGYSGSRGSNEGSGGSSTAPEPAAPEPSAPSTPAPSTSSSSMFGTWELFAARAYDGERYDLEKLSGTVKLVVERDLSATFYYFERDPFTGTLEREASRDSHYASDGYDAKCYRLHGPSSYWELAFLTSLSNGLSMWYLEVGDDSSPDSLFLQLVDSGDSGRSNKGGASGTGTMETSPFVGTWKLSQAIDASTGKGYDISKLKDQVMLVVRSETEAVFYYFDDEPFYGSLVRAEEDDAYYATDGYDTKGYHLVGGDGSYWAFAFCTDLSDGSTFWYLEVGKAGEEDYLFLDLDGSYSGSPSGGSGSGSNTSGSGGGTSSTVPALAGTWVLDYAHDSTGKAYDITKAASQIKLIIRSDETATFYYFDSTSKGTMMREATRDSYYDTNPNYTVQCYHLIESSGAYWEMVYIIPKDNPSGAFFYIEVGEEGDVDSLYLAKQ